MAATLVVACALSLICIAAYSEATLISSECFSLNMDSNGQQVCVNGVPSTEQIATSKSECALVCVAQRQCLQYNYLKTMSLCQLFDNNPKPLTKRDGCISYRNMVSDANKF